MIRYKNKVLRNLQEQVTENQDNIEELQKQEPGETYTAGSGIDITENVISVDNTVALKSELFSGDYDDLTDKPDLTVYATKSELNGYIKDNDPNYSSIFRGKGVLVKVPGADTVTSYGDGAILRGTLNDPDYISWSFPMRDGTLALISDIPTVPRKTSELQNDSGFITSSAIPTYTGGSGISISGTTISADNTLARVADIPSITGLTMYNYKITISGLDSGTSTARSAVYIVSLPYQWDYSSLTKYDIIRLVPVWSVVVDTDTTAGNKKIGRFHWQTGTIAQIDWVDGTFTFMDFTSGFNATVEAGQPAHW